MKKLAGIILSFILIFGTCPHVQTVSAHGASCVLADEEDAGGDKPYKPTVFAAVDITEMSIGDLQQAVDDGILTYEQIMLLYLDRIYAYGDMYHCITQISETAVAEARECDRIYAQSGRKSPVFGLPVIVKDNLDVAGMATTNGNRYLESKIVETDADVIAALREAGAIIAAKANMDRYAEHSQYSVSDYGRVNNAFDLSMSSYGSSGGSAVSAAASLAPICIGTDTNASIRVPAGANGVVGVRPTYGLLSRNGLFPCVVGRDTAGPIAKTVEDAAVILSALGGYETDYTEALDENALQGMRIGIIQTLWNFAVPTVREKLEEAVEVLEAQGATVVSMPIAIGSDWEEGVTWYGPYFARMMDEYEVDVAIHPTLWAEVQSHGAAYGTNSSCGWFVAPSAGVPAVSVPIGQNEKGLPYSMEFVARAYDDTTAIAAAYAFEQALGLHLKTPLAPNLYAVPTGIADLYAFADNPILDAYVDWDEGAELYKLVEDTYQSAVDYLKTSYYNDISAEVTAAERMQAYYDAVAEYRFAHMTAQTEMLHSGIWGTLRECWFKNRVTAVFYSIFQKEE